MTSMRSVRREHGGGVIPTTLRKTVFDRAASRRFEARLPAGRYKVRLLAYPTERLVDLVVPAGDGPLDLPDLSVESLAWLKMLGKPAAEIEATDLDGKPVKLAAYRGKVVILAFWSTSYDGWWTMLDRLIEIHKRFKDQPLAILALHDASKPSFDALKRAAGPRLERYFQLPDAPFQLLLERPPIGKGTGPFGLRAGEPGSGRTSDRYEVIAPETFLIGKGGELVQGFGGGLAEEADSQKAANESATAALLTALEDQLGLPRTPRPKQPPRPRSPFAEDPFDNPPPQPDGPVVVTGKVIGLDGKPVAGATVSPRPRSPEKAVKTDPTGAFSIPIDDLRAGLRLKVEARDWPRGRSGFIVCRRANPRSRLTGQRGPSSHRASLVGPCEWGRALLSPAGSSAAGSRFRASP